MKMRLRILLILTSTFSTGSADCQTGTLATSAASAEAVKPTIDDLFLTERLTATLLSPDGKSTLFMIQSNSGVNLWIADGSSGTRQLTSGKQVDENPRWSPDSQWLAFKSDRPRKPDTAGGHQIWL